ncbi:hypothetical protein [Paenibacillus jilunlii]|uniref:Uncharacterized protein n=1 Tax=Paenibacillus jilunlii TaxID=682956 RepID=A0ABR5T1Q8_9BACL|nr:hypothetical protein [Paenibacillus jilunlii]KWX81367.1 hypothetical protein AML91_00105 [Paenibacillus jilunlii]
MVTSEDNELFAEQARSNIAEGKDPSEAIAKAEGQMEGVHCIYATTSGVSREHEAYVYDPGQ